jgi:glycosyltransferase involved in cell wall biosynthesis
MPKKIAILMCTYNGERFISEQLDSIQRQTHHDWALYISDDGSTDKTLEIIRSWAIANSFQDRVRVFDGPRQGFANNFLSLTANQEIEADIFFWADQDDIWLRDKIDRTLGFFIDKNPETPILYCGRTILVDVDNVQYGLSPLQNKYPPSFGNALVQSLAGGNTMAFNSKARELITLACGSDIPSHDWWAYLAVSGHGGTVIYDPEPGLRYRQHGQNMIGSNLSIKAKFQRLVILANGFYKARMNKNIKTLLLHKDILNENNSIILDKFLSLRESNNIIKKLFALNKLKIRRQHAYITIALTIAFLFKRL